MRRLGFGILLTAAAFYLATLLALVAAQRIVQYPRGGEVRQPDDIGLTGVEVVELTTPDGERLRSWYRVAAFDRPTVLFLHGNAGTLDNRADALRQLAGAGFGYLIVSYRGYAGSTGHPTQHGLITDALTAFDWLDERGGSIVIHGQSLGSGVATQLALRRDALALVLEVPYASAVAVAKARYPMFPVSWLMWDQWRSDAVLADVGEPVLIAEAQFETVIPEGHAGRLFAVAMPPKRHVVLAGADHNSAWRHGLLAEIEAFLKDNEKNR